MKEVSDIADGSINLPLYALMNSAAGRGRSDIDIFVEISLEIFFVIVFFADAAATAAATAAGEVIVVAAAAATAVAPSCDDVFGRA